MAPPIFPGRLPPGQNWHLSLGYESGCRGFTGLVPQPLLMGAGFLLARRGLSQTGSSFHCKCDLCEIRSHGSEFLSEFQELSAHGSHLGAKFGACYVLPKFRFETIEPPECGTETSREEGHEDSQLHRVRVHESDSRPVHSLGL